MKILAFPLTKIIIVFITGIFISTYWMPTIPVVLSGLFLVLCAFGITYFISKRNFSNTVYFGLSTYLLAFSIGVSTQVFHTDYSQSTHYIHTEAIFDKPHIVSAVVREKLKSTNYSERYVVLVRNIDAKLKTGRILFNIRKESLNQDIEIGTHLQINGSLVPNSSAKNPNQFDYGDYLANKQIYAQLYADASEIKIGTVSEKNTWYYASKLRNRIIHNLEKNNFNKEELYVAVALILGQKQDISPEIIKDYQYAGAVHILSVSGLHIGLILLFINFILKPFPNTQRSSFVKLVVVLVSLSSFGLLAGLAPSVLRSVTMFCFVAIGMYWRRNTNIYHTLLVSMFLILLFQPSFLFDVGFQLSYCALFFILWLQPLLSELWKPKNKIAKYFWDILTVSFAAQIGTFPLAFYYFHQFPGLFFVTNLVVIPFLTFIMALGVLVMFLAAFNLTPQFLTQTLEWSIYYLNKFIHSIATFEQFIIRDIPFNKPMLISVYALLIVTIFWFVKPSFKRLVLVLGSVIVFQLTWFGSHWQIQNQKELVVFNVKKSTLIAVREGQNVVLYSKDSVLKSMNKNQLVTSYLMGDFAATKSEKSLPNLMYFNRNKILILDSLAVYPTNIRPDVVLLTQSPKINLERFLQKVKPKIIVADASNFGTLQKLWNATCLKEKIPFHAIAEKGFYKLD